MYLTENMDKKPQSYVNKKTPWKISRHNLNEQLKSVEMQETSWKA